MENVKDVTDNQELDNAYKSFEAEDEYVQSLALVDIIKDLLNTAKHQLNKVYVILAVSLIANILIVGAFLWYESHMSTIVETTTKTEQVVDGENSEINNVDGDQYKDNSVHNEG